MKIANIDREFLHIFWTTWGNSMKFSGKMCFEIILKVTENQGFTLSLEETFFEKPQGRLGLKFYILNPKNSQVISCKVWEMFVYKHTETIAYIKK